MLMAYIGFSIYKHVLVFIVLFYYFTNGNFCLFPGKMFVTDFGPGEYNLQCQPNRVLYALLLNLHAYARLISLGNYFCDLFVWLNREIYL